MCIKQPRLLPVLLCTAALLAAAGCSYQELPPRTDGSAAEYQSPQPSFPTAEEKAAAEAARAEYENAVKDL